MADQAGLEPATFRLTGGRFYQLSYWSSCAGTRDRTEDPPLKRRWLYQLSYTGVPPLGLEPRTLRLRGGCSNQLSYRGNAEARRIELLSRYQLPAVFETVSSSMPDYFHGVT